MEPAVQVSFCATNLNTVDRLPASLASIERLGQIIGVPYEVVVTDGPSDDGARKILEEKLLSDPRFRLVRQAERNRGRGRRLAFEVSSGTTIVPFDTSITYAPMYASLLARYLALRTDRMLFSEICALSRRSIEATGGWRDLIGGEDVDLYARVAERFGVLAYPTALPDSQSRRLRASERQWRYVRGGRLSRYWRVFEVQRDQIIGANIRVRDKMGINRRKSRLRRAGLWAFFVTAYVASRFRRLRPFLFSKNGYLLFRERLLASLLDREYRELGWDGPEPRLLLTDDEMVYLERASDRWKEFLSATPAIVGRK